ncbi:MAG: hypothetical protein MUE94_09305 [Verrucomicrobia bacterium]|jgi:hypothetical protein|nr:hypothetical protein [Verrucomicrobiota bacterium]
MPQSLSASGCQAGLALVAVLLWLGAGFPAQGQSDGSRPIEFSEPRDPRSQTNSVRSVGAERRRLTELEDRLSKAFHFLDFDDSMSGVPAPNPVRRAPVQPKPAKPAGLLTDEENWGLSKKSLEPEGPDRKRSRSELPSESVPMEDARSSQDDLLDSLRREDWLVNEMTSETFWEMPLTARPEAMGRNPPTGPDAREKPKFDSSPPTATGSRPGWWTSRDSPRDAFVEPRDLGGASKDRGEVYELGRPARRESGASVDAYRTLLGLGAQSVPSGGAGVGATSEAWSKRYGSSGAAITPQAPGLETGASRLRTGSLQPLRSVDQSLFAPTAPVAPPRPSVFDALEVEAAFRSTPESGSSLSKPFYEPPRRQF